ncbi:hypothetical protein IX83_08520 [Basilea psittacipulmonis DSM 24701]|uniref:Glutathione S-transferase n=2 Tax=Basilea TaxID=1472344 RepID=A0A077DIP7_9BURK|nr:hypothetical protein IX83_08520 [Basilea psittacipulmonis DSM 24701]
MKLYYLPGACSLVQHTLLEWSKAGYEAIHISRDALKQPAYLKLNPLGSVPCLEVGDFALTQNMAIAEFIHETFPQAKVWGSGDKWVRADARRWFAFCNNDLHRHFGSIFGAAKCIDGPEAQQLLAKKAKTIIMKLLAIAEDRLKQYPYLAKEKTAADVYLFVILRWVAVVGLSLERFPALTAFMARMQEDEGLNKAMKAEKLI